MLLSDVLTPYFTALSFAAEQHKYQRRGGYEPLPYINHLIKVTTALIQIGKEQEPATIIAAILHDVVEDSDTTVEDLTRDFGEQVAGIVAELTDDMALPYAKRKALQIERAPQLSMPARKVRIADKASNIRDIFSYPLEWSAEKKKAYLVNAIYVVDQIRGTHSALEAWFDESVDFARQTGSTQASNS